jgi:GMP synthase (glutamine-hydrolysing)
VTPRILVVQHEADGPPGHVGRWLLEAGCQLEVRRPYADEQLPEDLASYDGLLVLGGAMGANDDDQHPWLTSTKHLIRAADESSLPTLGICLGHQLVATALGGTSARNPRGQQIGLLDIGFSAAASTDPLFAAVTAVPRRAVHWNDDVVDPLPDRATVLAQTPDGEVQAARFGEAMWGVQLHPEVDHSIVASWVTDEERAELADRGLDADGILSDIEAARAELDEAWQPVAEAFARLVHRHSVPDVVSGP